MSAERGNGRLCKLWRILRSTIPYDADKAAQVVGLCLALSNYILDRCPVVDDILEDEDVMQDTCHPQPPVQRDPSTDGLQAVQGRNHATMLRSFLEGWCAATFPNQRDRVRGDT